jgi:hypothetical protein
MPRRAFSQKRIGWIVMSLDKPTRWEQEQPRMRVALIFPPGD